MQRRIGKNFLIKNMSDKVLLETYCINRIDRKDRWVAVRKILKNEEWKVKRFDAIIDEEAPFF